MATEQIRTRAASIGGSIVRADRDGRAHSSIWRLRPGGRCDLSHTFLEIVNGPQLAISRLHYPLAGDAAAVHFVFEPAHRRAGEMPGEPGARGAAAHNLVG